MTPERIHPTGTPLPLHSSSSTRTVEQQATHGVSHGELIRRAGQAAARWLRALRPDAKTIWIACGPGNNGADGYACASELQQALQPWGGQVSCTPPLHCSDKMDSLSKVFIDAAQEAGVTWSATPTSATDIAVDALFGLGQQHHRPIASPWLDYLTHLCQAPDYFAIDLPTGLDADTGQWQEVCRPKSLTQKRHTLSLLTLKPGLWTHQGRDAAGDIWYAPLIDQPINVAPDFYLHREPAIEGSSVQLLPHSSHKGTRGHVWVVGGAPGMTGATILAGTAAFQAGAGKVQLFVLNEEAVSAISAMHPRLMTQDIGQMASALGRNRECQPQVLVCGCGAGDRIESWLPLILHMSCTLILDADALNAVSKSETLQATLKHRVNRGWQTILTPHPAEAARLLNTSTSKIQDHRMLAAEQIASLTGAYVVLKGSGTVVASPYTNETSTINPTGDASLAVAGTGDELAGWLGGQIAQHSSGSQHQSLHRLICKAVWQHGTGLASTAFR